MKTPIVAAIVMLTGSAVYAQAETEPASAPAAAPVAVDMPACEPSAQPPSPPPALPLPVDPNAKTPRVPAAPHLLTAYGVGVLIGGGVTEFFGEERDLVDYGASWTARVEVGTRSHLAGEFAYVGTAQEVSPLGADTDSFLMSNGAEGMFRFNVLTGLIQPYGAVGIGWKQYRLTNAGAVTADISERSDVAHVPAAVGLAFRAKGLILDARFSVAAPINPAVIGDSRIISWDMGGRIGYEF